MLEQLAQQLSVLTRQAKQAARYREIGEDLRRSEGMLLFRRWREADLARAEAEDALRLIRNAGRVSSFCNDVIGDICGVISGSAAAVISARVLLLSKSGSEIFITLLLSAVVSGMTVGGKACGKSLAMNSSTAVVRTAAKVLCFFRTLPQRLEKKSAKK